MTSDFLTAVRVHSVGVTFPDRNLPGVAAFGWVKLVGPDNFALYVRNLTLMFEDDRYYVRFPVDTKKRPCGACRFGNVLNANYCNKCGAPLAPSQPKTSYVDIVAPDNADTRDMVTSALVAKYEAIRRVPA